MHAVAQRNNGAESQGKAIMSPFSEHNFWSQVGLATGIFFRQLRNVATIYLDSLSITYSQATTKLQVQTYASNGKGSLQYVGHGVQETPHWLGLTTWFFHYAPNQLVGVGRRVNKEKRCKLKNKSSRGKWISSVDKKKKRDTLFPMSIQKQTKPPQYVVKWSSSIRDKRGCPLIILNRREGREY